MILYKHDYVYGARNIWSRRILSFGKSCRNVSCKVVVVSYQKQLTKVQQLLQITHREEVINHSFTPPRNTNPFSWGKTSSKSLKEFFLLISCVLISEICSFSSCVIEGLFRSLKKDTHNLKFHYQWLAH